MNINFRRYLNAVLSRLREGYNELPDNGGAEWTKENFAEKIDTQISQGVGDYSNPLFQRVYILKYASAYGYEFSRIYKGILDDMGPNKHHISVSCMGAGTGIDYWGLCHAIEKLTGRTINVEYKGIEPVDWEHKIMRRPGDALSFPEDMRYFSDMLSHMRDDENYRTDDIYLFAHSIKEVCVNTVPQAQPEENKDYNEMVCLADFAHMLKKRMTDRPVYIAFSYRKKPELCDEFLSESEYENNRAREPYDTLYGTYLFNALQSIGLCCEEVREIRNEPAFAYAAAEETEDRHQDTYFFDPWKKAYMCGMPNPVRQERGDDDPYYRIYDNAQDVIEDHNVFGRIVDDRYITYDEWDRYSSKKPISSTKNMCFQIVKVTKPGNTDTHITEYERHIDQLAEAATDALRDMQYPVCGEDMLISTNELCRMVNERMESLITNQRIRIALKQEGFITDECTDKGKRYGMRMGTCDMGDGTQRPVMLLSPFMQKYIVANIISGKYLNYMISFEETLQEEPQGLITGELKELYVGRNSFLDELAEHLPDNKIMVKKNFAEMLNLMGYIPQVIHNRNIYVNRNLQEVILQICRRPIRYKMERA